MRRGRSGYEKLYGASWRDKQPPVAVGPQARRSINNDNERSLRCCVSVRLAIEFQHILLFSLSLSLARSLISIILRTRCFC